jgi:hypothetical protein
MHKDSRCFLGRLALFIEFVYLHAAWNMHWLLESFWLLYILCPSACNDHHHNHHHHHHHNYHFTNNFDAPYWLVLSHFCVNQLHLCVCAYAFFSLLTSYAEGGVPPPEEQQICFIQKFSRAWTFCVMDTNIMYLIFNDLCCNFCPLYYYFTFLLRRNKKEIYKIWGFYGNAYDERHLLGCDAIWLL